ncbi:MAG: hypothetical protein NTY09_06740 [bacterium]|nr:hypothetical protein [bacterium]
MLIGSSKKILKFTGRVATLLAVAILIFFSFHNQSKAYNPYYDDFTRLSCRPLSMGQAGTALSDDPSAIFYNPAALACQHRFALMHSHSMRHMPPDVAPSEVDQLDGDTQAMVIPLGPFLTAGLGFNFQGEMGYDYRPLIGQDEFPVERQARVERFEGLGWSIWPFTQIGAARRSFVHQYETLDINNRWVRMGDGFLIGLRQRIAPGLTYAMCKSKTDFDYTDDRSGRIKRSNKGWEFKPVAWLTFVWETEKSNFSWGGTSAEGIENPEPSEIIRNMNGVEINLGGLARLRCGSVDGDRTWGFDWTLGNLQLMYTEASDYLDNVLGQQVERMRDIHLYGFILQLP